MRKASRKPPGQLRIARERIAILFSLAGKEFSARPGRAHRYAELARRIGKRYNVQFTRDQRRKFCRKCGHYIAGRNSRVRASASQRAVTVTCLDCGNVVRLPYRREAGT